MTDEEYIQTVVDKLVSEIDRHEDCEAILQEFIVVNGDLRAAVARHILSRDPECVRIPLVGTVPGVVKGDIE